MIERWDGMAWTNIPSRHAGSVTQLFGVAAADATHAWAVGVDNAGHGRPFVEQYDGVSWSVASVQSPGPGSGLGGVVALSDNDVWSVGQRTRRTGRPEALVEHWNGTAWGIVPTPRVPHSLNTFLDSVSAVDSSDIWAVGQATRPAGRPRPLIEHWDGTAWSIVPSPDPGMPSVLASVVARASGDVWAVGRTVPYGVLAEHWDGTRWSVVEVGHPGKNAVLTGVSATSGEVYAVGWHQGRRALAERWNGTAFERVSMPRPGGRHRGLLYSAGTDGTTVWGVGVRIGRLHPLVEYVC